MAYSRKPNYHFKTKTDKGIDKVPYNRIIVVEDYDGETKQFVKKTNKGITSTSTIEDAVTNPNTPLKEIRHGYKYVIKNSNYTARANDYILADTSSAGFTITLPSAPKENDKIGIMDKTGSFGLNSITVARNGKTIMGLNENMIVNTKNISFELIYINNDWRLI